ncbi:MAG: DNA-binding response regulator [Nitrospirales bacterium]|nr:MAG: DNA-binding response regulator [Nitrospirales bacterium]
MRPRVVLADDHPMVLASIQKVLEAEFEVVGTAEDGLNLVRVAQQLQPDVIVLDMSMPMLNGLQAAQQLKKLVPACKLIFLTMHGDPSYVRQAFASGASGFLLKRSAATELSEAIHRTLQGHTYLTPLISYVDNGELNKSSIDCVAKLGHLTSRQQEVLQLIAEGQSTKEIATILHISVKTVEFHKSKIMERLKLHRIADLTKYALAHGLTEPIPPNTPFC